MTRAEGLAKPDCPPAERLPEPRSHTGCPTCTTARCCVAFDPELTGHDLVRLMSLGLAADDIAELRPTRLDQAGADALLGPDESAWDLRLRRTGAALLPPTGWPDPREDPRRCGFLVALGGAARCGVYTTRPMACRLFPSAKTSLGIFVATPEAICPPNAFAQERADLTTLSLLHRVAAAEREAYHCFTASWNARAPEHRRLGEVMARLVTFTRALERHDLREACDLALGDHP